MSMKGPMIKRQSNQSIPCAVAAILLGGALVGTDARADCSFASGYGISRSIISLPTNLTVQRDVPAGTVLWDSGRVNGSSRTKVECPGTNTVTYAYAPGISVAVPGLEAVYKTEFKGIGIRSYRSNSPDVTPYLFFSDEKPEIIPAMTYIPMASYRIVLIATGEIGSTGVLTLPSPLLTLKYGSIVTTELAFSNSSISVTKVACSLNSTSINVPLGDVLDIKFTAIGTTVGDKGFDVGLTCDKEARINVSLAGTQNSDTTDTSVLALTNAGQAGTAKGMGVQLLYGGTPLKINNNIVLKSSPGGQETLPFTARYYQTQTPVGAGKANSSATLNITYQ